MFNRRRIAALAVAAAAVLSLSAGVAVAASTSRTGTSVTAVSILTQDAAVTYTSTAWTNVGSTTIRAGASQIIDATFTAESACSGTSGWCSVRILIDGIEAAPVSGTDFSFNEVESATSWESHSVDRTRTVTFSGTHSVIVQTASVGTAVHRLDDWTLRVLAVAF